MADRYNPEKHNRRSIRLKGYDYAQCGAYFITICAQNRECLFGNIQHNEMALNHAGEMLYKIWNDLPDKCPGIVMDEFIVMPNHVHGIICIVGAPLVGALSLETKKALSLETKKGSKDRTEACKRTGTINDRAGTRPNRRAGTRPAPTTLGNVIGIFKSISTHQYSINVITYKWPPYPGKLWQRNYYERIIRNDSEMNRVRQYIINNPLHWDDDENNPINCMKTDFCLIPSTK